MLAYEMQYDKTQPQQDATRAPTSFNSVFVDFSNLCPIIPQLISNWVSGRVIANLMSFCSPLPNQIISLRVGIRSCDKKDGFEVGFGQLP